MHILENYATFIGTYDNIPITFTSNTFKVMLGNQISITKQNNQPSWLMGNLTYTLTVTNNSTSAYDNIAITDTIDLATKFVDGTIKLNGINIASENYSYDDSTKILTILIGTIPASGSSIITFDVEK